MKNKTALITGAGSGIGKAAAIAIARLGASVLIVCRTPEKAQVAAAEVRVASGSDLVYPLAADLSSRQAIHDLATEVKATHPALDVLLNNAGIAPAKRQLSVDGIELTFATNHLAYFLLTHQLLGALKAAPAARVVNVSSEAHRSANLDFENLQGEKRFSTWGAYCISKLCNLLFTFELARRLRDTKITANALHPGTIATSIFRETPFWLRVMVRLFAPGADKGARTSAYLACSPDVENVTGKYFIKQKQTTPSSSALDQSAAQRLWTISEELTRISFDVD